MLPNAKNTYCNPLPIPCIPRAQETWSVMELTGEQVSDYRSISDPSVLYHRGRWYLYPSYGMAWVSDDFIHWQHHRTEPYNMNYSPCVIPFGEKYLMTSHSNGLYEGDSPLGPFRFLGNFIRPDGSEFIPVDQYLFLDDDGRLYMYGFQWSENDHRRSFTTGTYGVELDTADPRRMLTDPITLHEFDGANEWERFGEHRQDTLTGWLEGQWMYKKNGRYYLIYAAAGTQYSSYCMAAYYSDEGPLSGFRLQKNNPITQHRTGFCRGAGHGCVTEGPNDTLWAFYTITLGYTHIYERRIGMDLLAINADGEIYAPHGVTETPQLAPGVAADPVACNSAGLYPLTCRQRGRVWATSKLDGREPFYALDESMLTFWQPRPEDACPSLTVDLEAPYFACAVRIMWKELGLDYQKGCLPGPVRYLVEGCPDADDPQRWVTLCDCSQNGEELNIDYRTFDAVSVERVRLTVLGQPAGLQLGVTDFTVFGLRDETV